MDTTETQIKEQGRNFWTRGMRMLAGAAVAGLGIITCLMNFFNPLDIGPYGLLSFFVATYIVIAAMFILVVRGVVLFFDQGVKQWHIYSAAIAAFAPIMLLALSTLGQLRITDFVLVLLFESIAIFYIFRRF